MNIELAKDLILKDERVVSIFATMSDDTKDAFLSHFCNYPAPFSFVREVDKTEINMKVKEFIHILPTDENGLSRLIEFFFYWKQRFDEFEKKVLNILSQDPKQDEYLFLRSSTFLNIKKLWEVKEIDSTRDEIKELYFDYLNRRKRADDLVQYYIIATNCNSIVVANKYTHQLYEVRKTMEVSGFANGEGCSFIPLMVKYEEVYETPIEEYKVWDGKL